MCAMKIIMQGREIVLWERFIYGDLGRPFQKGELRVYSGKIISRKKVK